MQIILRLLPLANDPSIGRLYVETQKKKGPLDNKLAERGAPRICATHELNWAGTCAANPGSSGGRRSVLGWAGGRVARGSLLELERTAAPSLRLRNLLGPRPPLPSPQPQFYPQLYSHLH